MWPINACPSFESKGRLKSSRSFLVNLFFFARGMLLEIYFFPSPAPFSITLANINSNRLGGNSRVASQPLHVEWKRHLRYISGLLVARHLSGLSWEGRYLIFLDVVHAS